MYGRMCGLFSPMSHMTDDYHGGRQSQNKSGHLVRVVLHMKDAHSFIRWHLPLSLVTLSLVHLLGFVNPSDSCVAGRHCQRQSLAIQVQRGKDQDLKRFSGRNRCAGEAGGLWASLARLHENGHFHVSPSLRQESITSTMGLQMAPLATQGCLH